MNKPGSKTSFYNINVGGLESIDVDYIAGQLELNFYLGNVLKALFGVAITKKTGNTRHKGTNIERDLNKAIFYLNKEKNLHDL